jgi:hypothetical protein
VTKVGINGWYQTEFFLRCSLSSPSAAR